VKLTLKTEANIRPVSSGLLSPAADEHEPAAIERFDTQAPRQIFSLYDCLASCLLRTHRQRRRAAGGTAQLRKATLEL